MATAGRWIVRILVGLVALLILAAGVMFEAPMVARLVAPNVLEKFADYSDAQFAGISPVSSARAATE